MVLFSKTTAHDFLETKIPLAGLAPTVQLVQP